MRRVPAPLAALLGATLVLGLTWIVLLPALQGPDEIGHVTYAQRMVERTTIPWRPGGGNTAPGRSAYSTEMSVADVWAGLSGLAANVSARPLWTDVDEAIWSREDERLDDADRADGDFTSAMRNPPLYYAYSSAGYAAASGGSIFDRMFVMRLANLPLLLVAVAFTWLLAAELLGRRGGWLPFAAAAPVAVHPQLHNVVATVNPDALLVAEWAVGLYLAAVVLRRGPTKGLVVALAAVALASAFTHYRGLPLVVVAAAATTIAWARQRGVERRRGWALAGGAGVLGAAGVVTAAAWGAGQAREFVSYAWQFYLPKLPFMQTTIGLPDYDFREGWIDRFYGTFAQLEVTLPTGLTDVLLWLSLAGLVALAVALFSERERLRRHWAVFAVLALAAVGLLAVLHVGAYRGMVAEPDDPVFTGRYLLPLLPLYGLAIALVASRVPARLGPAFGGVVVGAALVLQFVSVGILFGRFYG